MSTNNDPADQGGIGTTARASVDLAAPSPTSQGTTAMARAADRTHKLTLSAGDQGGIGTTLELNPPRMVARVEATKAEDGTIHLTFHES
jgi:hypothetical protein